MRQYNFKDREKYWQKQWLKEKTYEPDLNNAKKPFYNLMMFPYPSAEGLHVGNMYAFTGSDIYGRFKRMQGHDVFEPIGLDGFGIHSENYALKVKRHPAEQTKISGKNFYRQLQEIGNGFAWEEHLETYDSGYYHWTQWIFVQMFKHGLAYRKKQVVNWCPSCKTVLADEQVVSGECERCGSKVVKRELEQWFFRITKYADKLLKGLNGLDWSEKVKVAQKNWIGKSEGALIDFKIKGSDMQVEVFTTRADTILGATFLVLSPENPLITALEFKIKNREAVNSYIEKFIKHKGSSTLQNTSKTGIELKDIKTVNPATKKEIPIWISDYVLMEYGTGAIMAVPAHDERDKEFADKYKLPVADAPLVDTKVIVKKVGGKQKILYRLRDWLISRQRYWGPPIPMIFCPHCARAKKGERKEMPGWYTVPEKDLPVVLPKIKNVRPKGEGGSPLANVPTFYRMRCPACKREAVRETDVSDTFLDSSWYYLRYLDPKNKKEPFNKSLTKKWLPVDMYIGGAEHAVLHLLYVRFMAKVFQDWGLVNFDEPAKKFRAHGLLIREGAKISKSKGNIINPDDFVKEFGADALRMHLMFLGPFEEGGDFQDRGILGPVRFLERVWKLQEKIGKESSKDALKALHQTVKKVTEDIESLGYNTAISALMICLTALEKESRVNRENYATFLKLLAPFAPHITEEIWRKVFGHKESIHLAPWPSYTQKLIKEETITLVVQINGRVRDTFEVPADISESKAKELALTRLKIQDSIAGQTIKRVIYVPGRLINLVV